MTEQEQPAVPRGIRAFAVVRVQTPIGVLPVVTPIFLPDDVGVSAVMPAQVVVEQLYSDFASAASAANQIGIAAAAEGSLWMAGLGAADVPGQVVQPADQKADRTEAMTLAPTYLQFTPAPQADGDYVYAVAKLETPAGATHVALPCFLPSTATKQWQNPMDAKLTIAEIAGTLEGAWLAAWRRDNEENIAARRGMN